MSLTVEGLSGTSLGTRSASYTERDVILYALAVGAPHTRLDLVYETDLTVLPTFALTIGLWVVEAAGALGAYDPLQSLHVAQSLQVREPLPVAGSADMVGRIDGVWDKGKAAVVDIEVECDFFAASYSIYLPGRGGWGGPRGSVSQREAVEPPPHSWTRTVQTQSSQAALYRLTGDRHPVHIDPAVAAKYGFARPILQGLCTLGVVARELTDVMQSSPSLLRGLRVRFAAPVYPGDKLVLSAGMVTDAQLSFETAVGDSVVLRDGEASFSTAVEQR